MVVAVRRGGFLIAGTPSARCAAVVLSPPGFLIPFSIAAVAIPFRWGSATHRPAGSTTTNRRSSPLSNPCPTPQRCARALLGKLNSDGTVTGGIAILGLASFLSDPKTGKATVVKV